MDIAAEFRRLARNGGLDLPLPGQGHTPQRLRALLEIARTDLALARLAEPHADAIAILREAGAEPKPGALYAVWASEIPGRTLRLIDGKLFGKKMFCTGASLVDRALVTIAEPEPRLADMDLRASPDLIAFDESEWVTSAFSETHTATVTFNGLPIPGHDLIGPLPADTLFTPSHLSGADAVLAMYHDQGLPVLKMKSFGGGVNVTLGLPIVRTSVDHGTALDLAGSGRADPGSLLEALALARELSADLPGPGRPAGA